MIVVLFHLRTGSSLLMQTLARLGVNIIGEEKRKDLPPRVNPRGYWEHSLLLRHGLDSKARSFFGEQLYNSAFKIPLETLLSQNGVTQWQWLAENNAKLFLTVRDPVEMSESEKMLRKDVETGRDHFVRSTSFFRQYVDEIRQLAGLVNNPEFPDSLNIRIVDYAMAIRHSRQYVEQVVFHAGLNPSEHQLGTAIDNIEKDLYRYRSVELDHEIAKWAGNLSARQVYKQLISQDYFPRNGLKLMSNSRNTELKLS